MLLKVDEFVTIPVIVLFEVNVPSLTTFAFIVLLDVKFPELFTVVAVTPPLLITTESSLTFKVPCSNILSIVALPATVNVPVPEIVPRIVFTPFTVKLPILLIAPLFSKSFSTTDILLFV